VREKEKINRERGKSDCDSERSGDESGRAVVSDPWWWFQIESFFYFRPCSTSSVFVRFLFWCFDLSLFSVLCLVVEDDGYGGLKVEDCGVDEKKMIMGI
jgi:hypothetical protein